MCMCARLYSLRMHCYLTIDDEHANTHALKREQENKARRCAHDTTRCDAIRHDTIRHTTWERAGKSVRANGVKSARTLMAVTHCTREPSVSALKNMGALPLPFLKMPKVPLTPVRFIAGCTVQSLNGRALVGFELCYRSRSSSSSSKQHKGQLGGHAHGGAQGHARASVLRSTPRYLGLSPAHTNTEAASASRPIDVRPPS